MKDSNIVDMEKFIPKWRKYGGDHVLIDQEDKEYQEIMRLVQKFNDSMEKLKEQDKKKFDIMVRKIMEFESNQDEMERILLESKFPELQGKQD